MKTTKIICSIAALALAGLCSGQLLAQNSNEILYFSSYYNLASNRIDHELNPYPSRSSSVEYFEAPLNSTVFFAPVEFNTDLEDWMNVSLESSFYEEEIQMESWMTAPFESSYYEADPLIEDWMTRPFNTESLMEEEIEIEDWMTSPF